MADIMLYPKNTKTRMKIDLCGMWDFMFDFEGDGDLKDYSNGHFKGEQVPVPSSYNDFFTEEIKIMLVMFGIKKNFILMMNLRIRILIYDLMVRLMKRMSFLMEP